MLLPFNVYPEGDLISILTIPRYMATLSINESHEFNEEKSDFSKYFSFIYGCNQHP